jgi:anaerobic selenocysteine-containing dehydrogenase
MGVVHASRGNLPPAEADLCSEPYIVAEIARRTLARRNLKGAELPWICWGTDYDAIRDTIEQVVPGFSDFNERIRQPGGFELPNGPRERRFTTPSGKAQLVAAALRSVEPLPGELVLMTLRSHDQFNTTVYSNQDRYRGIRDTRKVLLVSPEDLKERGLAAGQALRITSFWDPLKSVSEETGSSKTQTRVLDGFIAHPYDMPRGTAGAYFPEANPLIFLESVAAESFTPTSKSVRIRIEPLNESG